jgi:hypothetical protein
MMKLEKNTIILLITALLLGSFVYIYEIKGKESQTVVKENAQRIFNFEKEEIKSFTIEREKEVLEFRQTDEELLPWVMVKPEEINASEGAVSFLINPLIGAENKDSFPISVLEKVDYGLDKPLAKLTIHLKNGTSHQLILGKPNFDEKFVYVLIDPVDTEGEELTVSLLPIAFKYGLERKTQEWKELPETPEDKPIEDIESNEENPELENETIESNEENPELENKE